jgi:hypothetical protein
LAQWHGDRQANFKKQYGHDIQQSTPEEQLNFMLFELHSGQFKKAYAVAAKDAREAGAILSREYERPKDAAGEASRRGDYAYSLWRGIPGATSTVASAGAVSHSTTANDNRVTNTVGTITINAPSGDPNAISRALTNGMPSFLVGQAARGVS